MKRQGLFRDHGLWREYVINYHTEEDPINLVAVITFYYACPDVAARGWRNLACAYTLHKHKRVQFRNLSTPTGNFLFDRRGQSHVFHE